MEFCEKCGSLILLKDGKAACASCSYKPKKRPKIVSSEKVEKNDKIAIIREGQDNPNPIVEIDCPKCKGRKAYFWTTQTRASDESETKFYKCTKCSHTWRVYK